MFGHDPSSPGAPAIETAARLARPAWARMQRRLLLSAGLLLAAGCAALWAWPTTKQQANAAARERVAGIHTTDPTMGPGAAPRAAARADDLGGGMQDAARLFELGFAGGVVIDERTRAALEIALAEWPRHPSAADIERIEHRLRGGLPRADADRVIDLLHRWRRYQATAARLQAEPPASLQDARDLQARLMALRRAHFGPELADALFGTEEALARFHLASQAIDADPRLDPAQRSAQRQALRAALPAAAREQAAALTDTPTDALRQADALLTRLRAAGATPAEVEHALREQVGAAEAEHLLEMERQQQDWAQRHAAYTRSRQTALAGVTDATQRRALEDRLLREHFHPDEVEVARIYSADVQP